MKKKKENDVIAEVDELILLREERIETLKVWGLFGGAWLVSIIVLLVFWHFSPFWFGVFSVVILGFVLPFLVVLLLCSLMNLEGEYW